MPLSKAKQKEVLTRVRAEDLTLEAILRGCTMLWATEGLRLLCEKTFHQEQLEKRKALLTALFGDVEIYYSEEDYRQGMMQDPTVRYAVETLGAVVATEE